MRVPGAAFIALAVAAVMAVGLVARTQRPVELTYYETISGQPSKQQRWYEWMHKHDSDRVSNVGMLGQGWDGIPRENRFPGTVGYQPPAAAFRSVGQALAVTPYGDSPHEIAVRFPRMEAKARTQSLSLDDVMTKGSDGYADAHKYLMQLRANSIKGQKAYVAKKAAQRAKGMKEGIKQASAFYAYTKKHGYGKDITRREFANLDAFDGKH